MKTNSSCCANTSCDSAIAELPRYYARQLITPTDLTLEQDYFRDRMRRHNRLLHGWGVVCGALVCPVTTKSSDGSVSVMPWQVQVGKGYILGPYGDEIILDCARTVDLRTSGVSGVTGEPCIDAPDPWCSQVYTKPTENVPLFIAVKYKQHMTRPVRVQPFGCGCDESSCEYSRWHDGYEIGVLQHCPPCNHPDEKHPAPRFQPLLTGDDIPNCPDCSCGPWVGLAEVTLNGDGSIVKIDNCSCRRLVLSFCNFWRGCADALSIAGVTGAPVSVTAGGNPVTVTVTGHNLGPTDTTFTFGNGVTVQSATETQNTSPPGISVDLKVSAAKSAALGDRTLTVVKADCSTAVSPKAITIVAKA